MKQGNADTIAAIATPLGEGGISVVRISGGEALRVADAVFRGKVNLQAAESHTAHFGRAYEADGGVIDEVVATIFVGPNSYTGEDTVEISCHGGILVTRRILHRILEQGARHAEAGEFTKRAFLNGRLDLSQAEAVADLIHARSTTAHQASIFQLEGILSERIQKLRSKLVDSIGLLELELDFVEEDLEFIDKREFRNSVAEAREETARLLGTFKLGRIYREGVKAAIVGPPNAGKSSLLNALLESNRAIVTEIPGTTRDTIEESVIIGGFSFKLVDTAGLRETQDPVEMEGIRRTEAEAQNSDMVLVVLDPSERAEKAGAWIPPQFCEALRSSALLVVLNKSDLRCKPPLEVLNESLLPPDAKFVQISAKTGQGIGDLQKIIVDMVACDKARMGESSATVTSARHYDALRRAEESLGLSLRSLEQGQSNEFVAVDLRAALDCLGEITGEVTTEEILNSIFSKFCIGK
jgi:tRNA modification GTPase